MGDGRQRTLVFATCSRKGHLIVIQLHSRQPMQPIILNQNQGLNLMVLLGRDTPDTSQPSINANS